MHFSKALFIADSEQEKKKILEYFRLFYTPFKESAYTL